MLRFVFALEAVAVRSLGDMEPVRYPPELPISLRRKEILDTLRSNQVLILAGETGSGKSTQLPKMCLEAGLAEKGKIGCTQPRRVAAMSVSRRVAEELGVAWGNEVGCKIRFNDHTGRQTRIQFMTDGILLAQIHSDPLLREYSTIILDEAHERSLNIDFLLGYLKGLLKRRPDLKLVVTSATIDTAAFSQAFGNAPIIEVSGRLFPVEIRYQPLGNGEVEEAKGTAGPEIGLVDGAALGVEDALLEVAQGDVLVFMPTERDIRDLVEVLEGRLGNSFEVLALFGRLSVADQQRVFSPGVKQRVIVATNIAETSITIPRIAAVVDTGFARISRYNPRNRTKRLPIELISQSSANQRAGRAGRLREGLCIRLYSEEEFRDRPVFTQPEIQRANLAEVILRMTAYGLGKIEEFPFLNPPAPAAIRAGYALLMELGALEPDGQLTRLGREMARLPVDPTLSRMLLQARQEGVLAEMLAIAAGIAVPDPRERPEQDREAASAAHARFAEPDSDYLGLLRIWQAAPPVGERSNGVLRRFCKAHFLSYVRMREWRDLYRQLSELAGIEREQGNCTNLADASEAERKRLYEAIHRSVLSGLLGQIGQRKERNIYRGAGDRMVTIFPGSSLYARAGKKSPASPKGGGQGGKVGQGQPEWIVAGEIVETSQLFARSVARIEPAWVLELGSHLCKFHYSSPQWSPKAGRVLVWEKATIHGLELSRRQIDHGRVNPAEATEIFIRAALVAGEANVNARFFAHNQALRAKIEATLARTRSHRLLDLDEAFFGFYSRHLGEVHGGVSSLHDLNRLLKGGVLMDQLCATEEDILGAGDELACDRALFPDKVQFGTAVIPIEYAYDPGTERDGITLRIPLPVVGRLSDSQLQWMVPGQREEKIAVLLRSLPRSVRRQLMPLEPKVRQIAAEFTPGDSDLCTALGEFIWKKFQVKIAAEDWRGLPDYLRPRVEVVGKGTGALATGRNLEALRAQIDEKGIETDAWAKAAKKYQSENLDTWSFGDMPLHVVVEEVSGQPVLAFPGLQVNAQGGVDLKLFSKQADAETASGEGIRVLAMRQMAREIQHLSKDLRELARYTPRKPGAPAQKGHFADVLGGLRGLPGKQGAKADTSAAALAFLDPAWLPESACRHIAQHLFQMQPVLPLCRERFEAMLVEARRQFPAEAYRVRQLIMQILDLGSALHHSPRQYPELLGDLARLLPTDFPEKTPHGFLGHLPRYLKAMQIRAERAALSPAKDAEKAKQLAPFSNWQKSVPPEKHEEFRWLLEEFRVSVFAQELGTAQPVSAARLKALGKGF